MKKVPVATVLIKRYTASKSYKYTYGTDFSKPHPAKRACSGFAQTIASIKKHCREYFGGPVEFVMEK
jgi:hypothetical protein